MLKECLNGSTIKEYLQRKQLKKNLLINPDEDLNKLGDEELNAKKAIMNKLFEKNATKPADKDFIYDIQVEYSNSDVEPCSWDCIYDADAVSVIIGTDKCNESDDELGGSRENVGGVKKHDSDNDVNYDTGDDDYDLDDDDDDKDEDSATNADDEA